MPDNAIDRTRQFELSPVLPDEHFSIKVGASELVLKIRHSDEDARRIWRMITDKPLQLSLAYVATVSPKPAVEISS